MNGRIEHVATKGLRHCCYHFQIPLHRHSARKRACALPNLTDVVSMTQSDNIHIPILAYNQTSNNNTVSKVLVPVHALQQTNV